MEKGLIQWLLLLVLGIVPLPAFSIIITPAAIEVEGVFSGDSIEREITVRNDTEKPIVIQEVRSSCGCATVNDITGYLGSGDSRTLSVKLEKNALGQIDSQIAIFCAGSSTPVVIPIHGFIKAAAEVMPSYMREDFFTTSSVMQDFLVKLRFLKKLDPQSIQPAALDDVFSFDRVDSDDNLQFVIKVRKDTPVGTYRDNIHFMSGGHSLAVLPYEVTIRPPAKVVPEVVAWGFATVGTSLRKEVLIGDGKERILKASLRNKTGVKIVCEIDNSHTPARLTYVVESEERVTVFTTAEVELDLGDGRTSTFIQKIQGGFL